MPLVEKFFENELTSEQADELIRRVTDAVVAVTNEKYRDMTWVVIDTVKSGHWGVAGSVLGLEDVRKMVGTR